MGLAHLAARFRIKTRRKAAVSRYVLRTQAGGPTPVPLLLLYIWCPPLRPALSVSVAVSAFGRTATFHPQSYFDLEVWRDVFEDGDYAIDLPAPPEVVFDLGAHVGLSALYFALKYPEARIYCFEAAPGNYAWLEKNVRAFDRISAYNYALCGESRPVRLYIHPRSVSHSVAERSESGRCVEVEGHDLDALMERLGVERIDLVKFNIEGMEFEVFDRFSSFDDVAGYVGYFHFDLSAEHDESYLDRFAGYRLDVFPSKPQRVKVRAVKKGEQWPMGE